MTAYLEQSLSQIIVSALTALDQYRGFLKHPALDIPDSARAFFSLYLKAHNSASEPHVRERQAVALSTFLDECGIADRIRQAPRGSGAMAARLSPRFVDVGVLGTRFDKLSTESRDDLFSRLFRPSPPTK